MRRGGRRTDSEEGREGKQTRREGRPDSSIGRTLTLPLLCQCLQHHVYSAEYTHRSKIIQIPYYGIQHSSELPYLLSQSP